MARVLVIDDEASIRETFTLFLRMAGHDADVARDASEALDLLGKTAYDLAFCDLVMPGLSGLDLLRALGKRSATTKIIMITGIPTVDTATEAWRSGAFDYLCKPVSREAVLRATEQALRVTELETERARLAEENRRYQEDLEHLVNQRTTVLKKQQRELEASRRKIQTFARQMLQAREGEKKRLSQVLHHEAGSLAVGLHSHLAGVEKDLDDGNLASAREGLAAMRERITAASKELRHVAVTLRPPDLAVVGLPNVLRDHIDKLAAKGAPTIRFRAQGAFDDLSENVAVALYRTAQEALTNVLRHAQASRADVALTRTAHRITLQVRDDGRGFSPGETASQDRNRLGLPVMEEMAQSEGGTLVVQSGPAAGTTVTLTLPLPQCRRIEFSDDLIVDC